VADPPAETAALARALGGGISPEILFGIGGGTGFGWFAYGDHSTLLTRITTFENAKESFLRDVCLRLGVPARLVSASTSPALRKRIEAAITGGEVVVALVMGGYTSFGGELVAHVDDALLARMAAVPGAARNRFLSIRPVPLSSETVRKAAEAGLAAHVRQMREGFGPPATRKSFGLAGFEKWRRAASALDASANAVLRKQIEERGGGPGLRLAQAAFLEELGLRRAANLTRTAAAVWVEAAAEPSADHVTAVEAMESEALGAVEDGITGG
jgi:hypothetical protein